MKGARRSTARHRATGRALAPYAVLAAVFVVGLALRPVLPVDETRYLTAAWEMWLRGNVLAPTVNFAPYVQKPPLLFWIIDLSWGVFGVSRAAALLPVFVAAVVVVRLTARLVQALLPDDPAAPERAAWLLTANLVFMSYASLVMFDVLLTAFVLGSLLLVLRYRREPLWRCVAGAGLLAGFGVLTKGPVVFVHLGWAVGLAVLLIKTERRPGAPKSFRAALLFAACAALPPLAWLAGLAASTGPVTLFNLIWSQSAGRVSGSLADAHTRPFYFFLPFLPLFFLPWLLLPDFWRAVVSRARGTGESEPDAQRRVGWFALGWAGGVVLTFSMISGKQPHYLVPILPPVTILLLRLTRGLAPQRFWQASLVSLAVLAAGHVAAARLIFPSYDLSGAAAIVQDTKTEWAVTRRYQGELNFLVRRTTPFPVLGADGARAWLLASPEHGVVDLNNTVNAPTPPLLAQPYHNEGSLRVFGPPPPRAPSIADPTQNR